MSFSISTWAIRNPTAPILLFLLLTLAGLAAFVDLPVTNMPNVTVPVVTVRLEQSGASPTEIETQITRKAEGALATMQGVRHITSTITEGASLTLVEFTLQTDFDRAVNDTRDAIANIRNELPSTMEEPIIQRSEEDGEAILTYSVEAPEMRSEELSWFIDDVLARQLLALGGIARVARSGGTDHEISITVDPTVMASLGITAADISRQLASTNTDVPGGRITLAGTEYSLRTVGTAANIAQLGEMRIALSNGREVKLGDLGTVTDGGAETRTLTRLDGRPAITFAVFRSKGASEVTVARNVRARLGQIAKEHPDIKFREIFAPVTLTETGFRSTLYTFAEGVLLTVLVVFVFLRDKRATLVATLAIPLSIIPTFLCMQWLGFTLNFVSTIAISLVTGTLVDDAIVEIENIHRHMRTGKSPFDAAMIAAEEIGLAVIATTLVICAVFVPVSLMDGLVGLYFRQFGLTVAIAAFFSLAVARLLTPMLAARFFRRLPQIRAGAGPWMQRYERLVGWSLRNRLKTVSIALASVLVAFALVALLPTGFMPYQDFSQSSLRIELPRGSTLEETDAATQRVAQLLRARPEVQYVLTTAGDVSGGTNSARVVAKLVPPKQRTLDERQFGNAMLPVLAALPDMRIDFDNAAGDKDISIALVSEDADALVRVAETAEREMRTLPGLSGVSTSAGQRQPEIMVKVDSVKAAQLGITARQIGDAINISTLGDTDPQLAKFNYQNRQIPIRVRLPRESDSVLSVIENLTLETPGGASVPLSSVASIDFGNGPTTIHRYDRQRKIDLEANLNGIALGTALERIYALPSMKSLPKQVTVLDTADAEFMAELFARFLKAVGAGLLMVYAIQVLLYKDWLQPITRMAAMPLSIGGAFLLMFLTRTEMGLPALIGMLMLLGIADKNSILLVDYMLDQIRNGVPRQEAILQACRIRARPIVMTSLAMTAGMLPTALGLGLDPAFRAPMAIAVIGGLISSTALSLIFMPVLFSYVRDFEEWIVPKFRQLPLAEGSRALPSSLREGASASAPASSQ